MYTPHKPARSIAPRILLAFVAGLAFSISLVASAASALSEGSKPPVVIDAAEYASIQAALDAVPPRGGEVQLPPGTYKITEPLVIDTEDTHLTGAGAATHIQNVNEDGAPTLVVRHPDAPEDEDAKLWRVQLSNFRITGNEQSGHGIEAIRINEIFVDGVTASYHGGDGIHLFECYEDPRVSDSLITYNKGIGLNLIGCHDIVVSANQFEENGQALVCTDGYNLTMSGNNLDDHLGEGVVIENTYGSVVASNMIEECQDAAIVLDRDCYGITLSANVIAHNGAGILLRDAHGCAVSANTFTIMKTQALLISSNSGRITVTGNNFSNSYIGMDQVKRRENDLAAAGIILRETQDISITGNVFSGLTTKALAVEGKPSRRVVFTGNVLRDNAADTGKLVDSVVSGNIVSAAGNGDPAGSE